MFLCQPQQQLDDDDKNNDGKNHPQHKQEQQEAKKQRTTTKNDNKEKGGGGKVAAQGGLVGRVAALEITCFGEATTKGPLMHRVETLEENLMGTKGTGRLTDRVAALEEETTNERVAACGASLAVRQHPKTEHQVALDEIIKKKNSDPGINESDAVGGTCVAAYRSVARNEVNDDNDGDNNGNNDGETDSTYPSSEARQEELDNFSAEHYLEDGQFEQEGDIPVVINHGYEELKEED